MQLRLNSVVATASNLYHRDRQKQQIDKYHRKIYNAVIDRKPETAKINYHIPLRVTTLPTKAPIA
jgi:DNA-binding FadR family transcriptional regulator